MPGEHTVFLLLCSDLFLILDNYRNNIERYFWISIDRWILAYLCSVLPLVNSIYQMHVRAQSQHMRTLKQPTHNQKDGLQSTSTNQVSAITKGNLKHVRRTLDGIKALAKHQSKIAIDLT